MDMLTLHHKRGGGREPRRELRLLLHHGVLRLSLLLFVVLAAAVTGPVRLEESGGTCGMKTLFRITKEANQARFKSTRTGATISRACAITGAVVLLLGLVGWLAATGNGAAAACSSRGAAGGTALVRVRPSGCRDRSSTTDVCIGATAR